MTLGSAGDIHSNIKWFYLGSLGYCYILSVFVKHPDDWNR
jgi:hypothetical protein